MSAIRRAAWALVAAALAIGAAIDRPAARPPLTIGGYRVLAADFHTHSSTWSDGALTPFGLVLEAKRQGLDAIAITGHNEVIDAKVGRWFSRLIYRNLERRHLADEDLCLVGQPIVCEVATKRDDVSLLLQVTGHDENTSQTVRARKAYSFAGTDAYLRWVERLLAR